MRLRPRLLCASLTLLAFALPARRAFALDWIVVPYAVSQPGGAVRAADRLVGALAERRLVVASQHELKDLFLARSRAQIAPHPQQRKILAEARKHALEHAAYGRRDAARRAAEEAMSVAEQTPEVLRDTDAARHVLDACLAVVRVDLQERDRPLALQDAQRCRRLVPDLAPRESTHSAEVVGVLAEAENELRRAGAGALNVVTRAREPCSVFIQGRRLGVTPFRYEHAAPGPTAVFVECDAATSRVRKIRLDEREQTLTIDAESDARTWDRDVIALVFASEQELNDHLAGDVQRIGETVGARDVVLVRELPGSQLEIVRYDMNRRLPVALARIDAASLLGEESAAARRVAEFMATQRREAPMPPAFQARPVSQSASLAAPVPIVPSSAPPPSAARPSDHGAAARPRAWTWTFGAGTAAAGAAALGLGLAVDAKVKEQRECQRDEGNECDQLQHDGDRLALATNVMVGVAGAFAIATLAAFIVEGRSRRPVQAAVGIGPAGLSLRGAF